MSKRPVPAGYRRDRGFLVPESFRPAPPTEEAREPFYSWVIRTARRYMRFQGLEMTVDGAEHYPVDSGAMIVGNHTGYFDFVHFGVPAFLNGGRLVRFMAKKELFEHRIAGPMMRWLHHIEVDRFAGAAALDEAIRRLRAGALVGIFPEATISRSFEIKSFKTGAARIARDAEVPLIPVTIFGGQRLWAKGGERRLGRSKIPVWIRAGEPILPGEDAQETTDRLHAAMVAQLAQLREDYIDRYGPFPEGLPWMPAALGGSAPTLEEANAMDERDREARRRAHEERKAREAERNGGGS
ncbi:hypothetical protein CSPHI_11705 [Corynebacterium sphenisci DSM 44792]|uniref:Phospholipid/glycerol acyltransferase domain-containing protein n=1 Tax=Corynebacterium sphenisci DSM 44792 TaxID=1437874 RepID=A0A1L7D047_9CORY|nr:lysophospholipid acyltransferase family protein [Corynebacterium sphenisci]APT91516.1 hypothetical protein CSPHI_11705 [Corynebacterium sphenisci DSM 44792]